MKLAVLLAGAGILVSGCADSEATASGFTFSMQLSSAVASLNQSDVSVSSVGASQSFTPTSFKLPVMKISMSAEDGSNEQILYSCASTAAADCLVDMADQTALDTLAARASEASIEVGTYKKLSLHTCVAGSSGSDTTVAYVKGAASFQGGTWRTDASDIGGVAADSAAAEETEVGNWGCATKNVLIRSGIDVTATTDLSLTVIVDNTYGASFGITVSPGRGGCKAPGGGGSGLCVEYPALLPYVGIGTPSVKRYLISHHINDPAAIQDAKANALILVGVDGANVPLLAFGRILYTATSALISQNTGATDSTFGGPNYITETNFETFAVNADSTISFEQGGSADTYAATFAAFQVTNGSHQGDVVTKDGLVTWKYKAIPLL